jgi:alpha-glucosidase (family GH31 glycosyl hydrolase)
MLPEIQALVDHAARTGEPILRPLAYHHPGYEAVHDEFLLGEDILVAPVLERGATTRTIRLPPGRWVAPDGSSVAGPATVEMEVGLGTLPLYRR